MEAEIFIREVVRIRVFLTVLKNNKHLKVQPTATTPNDPSRSNVALPSMSVGRNIFVACHFARSVRQSLWRRRNKHYYSDSCTPLGIPSQTRRKRARGKRCRPWQYEVSPSHSDDSVERRDGSHHQVFCAVSVALPRHEQQSVTRCATRTSWTQDTANFTQV